MSRRQLVDRFLDGGSEFGEGRMISSVDRAAFDEPLGLPWMEHARSIQRTKLRHKKNDAELLCRKPYPEDHHIVRQDS